MKEKEKIIIEFEGKEISHDILFTLIHETGKIEGPRNGVSCTQIFLQNLNFTWDLYQAPLPLSCWPSVSSLPCQSHRESSPPKVSKQHYTQWSRSSSTRCTSACRLAFFVCLNVVKLWVCGT